MLIIKPTPAKIKKFKGIKKDNELKIPNVWKEFALLCKIRSGGDIVNFNPYQYQIDLVNLMLERSVCIVKSRQLGISETITCFMLWRACLNPGYLGLVFSKTQQDSSLLARRMRRMIESLGLRTETENLSDISILNRGRILFRNSNPDSARGIESVVDVFFDEFAFLDTAKEIYDAMAPSQQMLGDKARVFAVSTPNGKSGFFYDLLTSNNGQFDIELLCEKASKGTDKPFQYWIDNGGWGKVLIHWKAHDLYGSNPNFLDQVNKKQKLSWEIINREYNLSFQDSAVGVFSSDLVRQCSIGQTELLPDKDADYYCGLDVSTVGQDYTVLAVLKYKNNCYSLVNFYRKRQQTSDYHLYQIVELLKVFKPKVIGVEVTGGTGQVYMEQLIKQLSQFKFQAVKTTADSKPMMISTLLLAMEQTKFLYPENSVIIDELLSFRREGQKLQASSGKHDDLIMACSFAVTVSPFNESKINPFANITLGVF